MHLFEFLEIFLKVCHLFDHGSADQASMPDLMKSVGDYHLSNAADILLQRDSDPKAILDIAINQVLSAFAHYAALHANGQGAADKCVEIKLLEAKLTKEAGRDFSLPLKDADKYFYALYEYLKRDFAPRYIKPARGALNHEGFFHEGSPARLANLEVAKRDYEAIRTQLLSDGLNADEGTAPNCMRSG